MAPTPEKQAQFVPSRSRASARSSFAGSSGLATTTPRPIPLVKVLLKDPTVAVTGGSSYENLQNLPEFYIEQVIRRFEGTRLGKQEIYAQLLGDTPGALWTRDLLERTRVKETPTLARVVVAVDPAASSSEGAAETGIIVAGAVPAQRGRPAECYVLDNLSMRGTPAEWARAVCTAYRAFRCDRVVAEANQGGRDGVGHHPRVDVLERELRDALESWAKTHRDAIRDRYLHYSHSPKYGSGWPFASQSQRQLWAGMLAVAEVADLLDAVATYCRTHERAAERRMELPLADALRGLLDTLPAGRYRYPDLCGRLRQQHGARADRWSEERIGRVIKYARHPRIAVADKDMRGRYVVVSGAATASQQQSDLSKMVTAVATGVAAAMHANRGTAAPGGGTASS